MTPFTFLDPARWAPRPQEDAFRYWLSLTPMAPAFGLAWRFAPDYAPEEETIHAVGDWRGVTAVEAEAEDAETPPAPASVPAGAAPAPAPAPAPACGAEAAPDDLTRIRGIGPKMARELEGLGITRLGQLAAMTPGELAALGGRLSAFRDRPLRDDWAGQARALLAG